MSNVKDAVVKRIRALCEEKNIKPNELAKRAGLTPSTVYSIFNENRHDVNISTIKILCDGFKNLSSQAKIDATGFANWK